MPDLRELLDGAVDPPTLDAGILDGMAQRLAHRRRHRRLVRAATAAAVLVLVGATVVALTRSHTGNDVEMPPVGDPDRITTTVPSGTTDEPGTSTTTTTDGEGNERSAGTGDPLDPSDDGTGPAGPGNSENGSPSSSTTTTTSDQALPACTPADVDIVPDSEGATAQQVVYPGLRAAPGGGPCSVNTTATVTLRDVGTDAVLDIETNPLTVTMSGTLGGGQDRVDYDSLILSGCVPGDEADERGDVVADVSVAGLGTGRAVVMGSRCGDPRGGLSFSAFG